MELVLFYAIATAAILASPGVWLGKAIFTPRWEFEKGATYELLISGSKSRYPASRILEDIKKIGFTGVRTLATPNDYSTKIVAMWPRSTLAINKDLGSYSILQAQRLQKEDTRHE